MNKISNKKLIVFFFSVIVVIFATRILFFLKDTANKNVELVLIYFIFYCSLLFLGMLIYKNWKLVTFLCLEYKDKVLIIFFVIIMELLFVLQNGFELSTTNFLASLFTVLLIMGLSLLVNRRLSKAFDIAFVVFYSIYVFSQDLYYSIFSDLYSFVEFGTFQEGVESSENMYQFAFYHLIILLLMSSVLYLLFRNKKVSHVSLNRAIIKKVLLVYSMIFLLINLNAEYPVKSARMHLSDHYLYQSVYSKKRFVMKFGNINLIYRDALDVIIPPMGIKKDIEYIDQYYTDNIVEHTTNEYSGIFKDKNLIFIVGESFDLLAVNETLTPNIWKLKTEGLDFVNYYTPVFPRTTCDTEIAFNTSILPSIEDGPTCYVYNENSYKYSIANMFNDNDYETNALHSNYKEFYTRSVVYKGLGYDNFYGQHELGLSDTDKRYDELFMESSYDKVLNETNKFFDFYLTLSGHSPYAESHLIVQKNLEEVNSYYEGEEVPLSVRMFIATQIELDDMVGNLLAELEAKGILDDTVIILTNDHYPYTLNHDDYESYTGNTRDYEKNKSPLYIWSSDIEHEAITTLSSSIDLLPTIVNLFDLGDTYQYYVGNDVFGGDYNPIVFFKDYSILTIDGYFVLSDATTINQIVNDASDKYKLSRKLLKVDYYKE